MLNATVYEIFNCLRFLCVYDYGILYISYINSNSKNNNKFRDRILLEKNYKLVFLFMKMPSEPLKGSEKKCV